MDRNAPSKVNCCAAESPHAAVFRAVPELVLLPGSSTHRPVDTFLYWPTVFVAWAPPGSMVNRQAA
jgi:hypothetical protein